MVDTHDDEGRSGRSNNGNEASPRGGVKAAKIAGTGVSFLRAKGPRVSAGATAAPADLSRGIAALLAAETGATISVPLPPSELVAFEAQPDGTISVELADGTKTIVLSERHPSVPHFPSFVIGAETFLKWMGRYASLPIGASPVGRRFIRRSAVTDGVTNVRFSEAGRDV